MGSVPGSGSIFTVQMPGNVSPDGEAGLCPPPKEGRQRIDEGTAAEIENVQESVV